MVVVNAGSTTTSPTQANPLNASSLGSGTLTLTSGIIDVTGGALTFNNFLAITNNAVVGFTGQNLTFNPSLAAPVALPVSTTLVMNNTTTFTGVFTPLPPPISSCPASRSSRKRRRSPPPPATAWC